MNKPNIIFIFSDQHNSKVMGNAGDPYIKTPTLDRLASKGVRLDNCYCNSPLCVPSRSSMLTGRLPIENRVLNNNTILHSTIPTFAHSATIGGYETVLAGRMHFNGLDQHHGFEKRLVGDIMNSNPMKGTGGIFESFTGCMGLQSSGIKRTGPGNCSTYAYDKDVTNAAVEFIKNRKDERPLFMTIGLFAPHPPFIAEQEKFDYYFNILPEAEMSKEYRETIHPAMKKWQDDKNLAELTSQDKKRMRASYYALVDYLDENIGKILSAVENVLDIDNTIIVYSSDHGESMGINDFYWKTTFFESSVKIPAIFSFPKEFMTDKVINDPVSLLDFSKTFVEWTEGPELPFTEGQSLTSLLKGDSHFENGRTIISQIGNNYPGKDKSAAMIKKGKWKLIDYYGFDEPALFNLENDPEEIYNLGNKPEYKEKIIELMSELSQKWNSKEAFDISNYNQQNIKIISQWRKSADFEFPQEWHCERGTNYLHSESEI